MKPLSKNILLYTCAAAIFVAGALFWTNDLNADPPLYVAGLGQTLSTDPAQYVYHARNKVLFGDPDPFDYPRWLVYQRSLTSLVAHLWFSVAGVSYKQANVVGIILSLGALLMFLFAVARHHRPWVIGAFTLCYLINITLLVHGRLSYLENGLLLITSVLYLVYSRWRHRTWGIVLCGALAASAMLMGKLFGALLLPALLASEWFSDSENRIRRLVICLGAFVCTTAVIVVASYGTSLSAVLGYFTEQSYGLRGFPAGLSSPWGFFEHLIAYGFKNRLSLLDTELILFIAGTGFLLTYLALKKSTLSGLSPVVRLSVFATVFIFVGLMPLNYSPIRYALFLIPPIIIAWLGLLDEMMKGKTPVPENTGLTGYVALFLVLWYGLFQAMGLLFFINNPPTRTIVWSTLPVAIVTTQLIRRLMNAGRIRLRRSHLYAAAAISLVACVGSNAFRINERVLLTTNYTIVDANEDIGSIIGPGAVLSGPYGPVLTIDNELTSFIHLFGVARVDTTLFERYPITHLAIDSSNWGVAVANYPTLANMTPMTAFWIRDFDIKVCNVSRIFGNAEAARYQRTGYERAVDYYSANMFDSAYTAITEFLVRQPDSRSGNLLLAHMMTNLGYYEQAVDITRKVATRYPTDYHSNLMCGRAYQILGISQRSNYLMRQAQVYYERAVKNNPFRAPQATAMWEETIRLFSGAPDSTTDGP